MAKIRLAVTRKKAAVIAVGLALIGLVVVVLLWKFSSPSTSNDGNDDELISIENVQYEAESYKQSNDLDGGLNYYDEKIASTGDEDHKKELLLQKSYFAEDLGDPQSALEAAEQAYNTKKDSMTMIALAELYEELGEKEKALDLYKKILEHSLDNGGSPRMDGVWERKIEELSS